MFTDLLLSLPLKLNIIEVKPHKFWCRSTSLSIGYAKYSQMTRHMANNTEMYKLKLNKIPKKYNGRKLTSELGWRTIETYDRLNVGSVAFIFNQSIDHPIDICYDDMLDIVLVVDKFITIGGFSSHGFCSASVLLFSLTKHKYFDVRLCKDCISHELFYTLDKAVEVLEVTISLLHTARIFETMSLRHEKLINKLTERKYIFTSLICNYKHLALASNGNERKTT